MLYLKGWLSKSVRVLGPRSKGLLKQLVCRQANLNLFQNHVFLKKNKNNEIILFWTKNYKQFYGVNPTRSHTDLVKWTFKTIKIIIQSKLSSEHAYHQVYSLIGVRFSNYVYKGNVLDC
jgi:hypothetical protein